MSHGRMCEIMSPCHEFGGLLILCGSRLCFVFVLTEYVFLFLFFETSYHYAALVGPDFAVFTRLTLNSLKSGCLCHLRAGIKGVSHRPGRRSYYRTSSTSCFFSEDPGSTLAINNCL